MDHVLSGFSEMIFLQQHFLSSSANRFRKLVSDALKATTRCEAFNLALAFARERERKEEKESGTKKREGEK